MQASDKIKEFIRSVEGCRLTAYKPLPEDRWTIGYGTTFYTTTKPVKQGDTITQDAADELVNRRINDIAYGLSLTRLPTNITQNQFDAAVSLVYNIGFTAFKSSATGKLFYAGMNISEKFPMWNRSNGEVIEGLTERRKKEQQIYDHGIYT